MVEDPREYLDLFSLQILALLVCRGEAIEKAERLYEIVAGSAEKLMWSDEKLKKAIYKIFFYSEFLPKKYYILNGEKQETPTSRDGPPSSPKSKKKL